jgi:hypothetical protein
MSYKVTIKSIIIIITELCSSTSSEGLERDSLPADHQPGLLPADHQPANPST